jgi:potassium channel subfamily K, invertebrate
LKVGYGDFFPKTVFGRIYLVLYACFGVFLFALSMSFVNGIIFEVVESLVKLVNYLLNDKFFKKEKKYIPLKITALMKLLSILNFLFIYTFAFGLIMSVIEQWDFGTGLWYGYITVTTIGLNFKL